MLIFLQQRLWQISIHAPHEGERLLPSKMLRRQWKFQSTLPTRGSDTANSLFFSGAKISIHAPHEGERLNSFWYKSGVGDFNPRSPRGGATLWWQWEWFNSGYFNPRSPRGGATS